MRYEPQYEYKPEALEFLDMMSNNMKTESDQLWSQQSSERGWIEESIPTKEHEEEMPTKVKKAKKTT